MTARLTDQELRVWQKFIRAADATRREVGRELWDDAQLSEPDFTVLAELSLAPDNTMRSTQCARAVGWDTGRLSHHLRRMEERGLISRGRGLADDRRAAVITLTDEGRTAYRKALGPHLRSAQRWFLAALDQDQLAHLDDILTAVLTHVEASE